jgi:histone H3/H4
MSVRTTRSGGPPPLPTEESDTMTRRKRNNKKPTRIQSVGGSKTPEDVSSMTAVNDSSQPVIQGSSVVDSVDNIENEMDKSMDNVENTVEDNVDEDENSEAQDDNDVGTPDVSSTLYSPLGLVISDTIINGPSPNLGEVSSGQNEDAQLGDTSGLVSENPVFNQVRPPVRRTHGGKALDMWRARHKKPKKVGMQNLTKPTIRSLARCGDVTRIAGLLYEPVRDFAKRFLKKIMRDDIVFMESQCRKTLNLEDVRRSAAHNNQTVLL